MKQQFDNKPEILTPADEISIFYHWNINEITIENEFGLRTLWEADEILLYYPLTKNKILEGVIEHYWSNSEEKKLINDYLSTFIIDEMDADLKNLYIIRYKNFIMKRNELKNMVDLDCNNLNIV